MHTPLIRKEKRSNYSVVQHLFTIVVAFALGFYCHTLTDKAPTQALEQTVAQEPIVKETVSQEPIVKERVSQEPVAQEPVKEEETPVSYISTGAYNFGFSGCNYLKPRPSIFNSEAEKEKELAEGGYIRYSPASTGYTSPGYSTGYTGSPYSPQLSRPTYQLQPQRLPVAQQPYTFNTNPSPFQFQPASPAQAAQSASVVPTGGVVPQIQPAGDLDEVDEEDDDEDEEEEEDDTIDQGNQGPGLLTKISNNLNALPGKQIWAPSGPGPAPSPPQFAGKTEDAASYCITFSACCNWPGILAQCQAKITAEKPDALTQLKRDFCAFTRPMKYPDLIDLGIYAMRLGWKVTKKVVDKIPFVGIVTQLITDAQEAAAAAGFDLTAPITALYSCLATPNLHQKMFATKLRNSLSVLQTNQKTKETDLLNWYYLRGLVSDRVMDEVEGEVHQMDIPQGSRWENVGVEFVTAWGKRNQYVKSVTQGSIADLAGIKVGMKLKTVSGAPVDPLNVEKAFEGVFVNAEQVSYKTGIFTMANIASTFQFAREERKYPGKRFPMVCRLVYSFRFCAMPALFEAVGPELVAKWIMPGVDKFKEIIHDLMDKFFGALESVGASIESVYKGIMDYFKTPDGITTLSTFDENGAASGGAADTIINGVAGATGFKISNWGDDAAGKEAINFWFMYIKTFREKLRAKVQGFWGPGGKLNWERIMTNFQHDPGMMWLDFANAIIEDFIAPMIMKPGFKACNWMRDSRYLGNEDKPVFTSAEVEDPDLQRKIEAAKARVQAMKNSAKTQTQRKEASDDERCMNHFAAQGRDGWDTKTGTCKMTGHSMLRGNSLIGNPCNDKYSRCVNKVCHCMPGYYSTGEKCVACVDPNIDH